MRAAIVLAVVAVVAPFALGERTLLERDVTATHLPYKSFGATEIASGRVPATFPEWALGQPFAGNPNALPWYPGNLLYAVLPFWSAFNLHFVLHLLLAFAGMRALGRRLGQSATAAALSGVVYAGSGYFVSTLTFYNLLTVAAWAPVALAGIAAGGRRGTLVAALAGGMMLLGGEPITALLAVPAAVLVAARHGPRRGAGVLAGAGALALLVALPQVVATARVLPHSFRGAHGVVLEQVTAYAVSAWRLVELVIPVPWGALPARPPWAYWPTVLGHGAPYVFSLSLGIVALALVVTAMRKHRGWIGIAAGALALGWAAGLSAEATAAATFGLFRFPQKFAFLFTLAAAPVAGFGLDAALARPRVARTTALVGVASILLALGLLFGREALAAWLGATFAPSAPREVLHAQAGAWTAQIGLAGALLLATAGALARRRPGLVVFLQVLTVLELLPFVPTETTRRLAQEPKWASLVGPSGAVVSVPYVVPAWEPRFPYGREAFPTRARKEIERELLAPWFAAPVGLASPLAPDLDGLSAPLQVFLSVNLVRADWEMRVRWLRRLGVGALVREDVGPGPELERIAEAERFGGRSELLRVPDPRPFAFRPREVRSAPGPREAYLAIARAEVGDDVAILSRPAPHGAAGSVRVVEVSPDEILLDVEGEGGVVGVLRAASPLWRAELAGGDALPTATIDLVLLGVEVPPGTQRVRLYVPRAPEVAAGTLAVVVAAAALVALVLGRRSS